MLVKYIIELEVVFKGCLGFVKVLFFVIVLMRLLLKKK